MPSDSASQAEKQQQRQRRPEQGRAAIGRDRGCRSRCTGHPRQRQCGRPRYRPDGGWTDLHRRGELIAQPRHGANAVRAGGFERTADLLDALRQRVFRDHGVAPYRAQQFVLADQAPALQQQVVEDGGSARSQLPRAAVEFQRPAGWLEHHVVEAALQQPGALAFRFLHKHQRPPDLT